MKPIYTKLTSNLGDECIQAKFENGVVFLIPINDSNADYQRYLRWLENPDADESGTL